MAAIRAVALNTVIGSGVMACGNHDAAAATQFTNSVRQHRGRCKTIIQPGVDTSLCEGNCADLGKQLGVMSGIICDGCDLGKIRRRKPGSHTLGGAANSVPVQTITAHTHNTAHTGGAKLEVTGEAALEFFLVVFDRI